jgi:hypothetical protein
LLPKKNPLSCAAWLAIAPGMPRSGGYSQLRVHRVQRFGFDAKRSQKVRSEVTDWREVLHRGARPVNEERKERAEKAGRKRAPPGPQKAARRRQDAKKRLQKNASRGSVDAACCFLYDYLSKGA